MKLSVKNYKIVKTKKYFKTNSLFFFVNGINRNSLDWLTVEQELKTVGFDHYKILNKTTTTTLNTSIYANINSAIKGSTFLLKPQLNKYFSKNIVLSTFNLIFFELLSIKLNNKAYSIGSMESVHSFQYKETKLLLYQFCSTHLKTCYKLSK